MKYDIKAIPTTYAGVRFRSRLEARWAAFFDLAKIKWEYEPFDLNGWAPDFLLSDRHGIRILVEVKPTEGDNRTHFKKATNWEKSNDETEDIYVMCLGRSPLNDCGEDEYEWGVKKSFAFSQFNQFFFAPYILIGGSSKAPIVSIAILHNGYWIGFNCESLSHWKSLTTLASDSGVEPFIEKLWNEAGNAVQWMAA